MNMRIVPPYEVIGAAAAGVTTAGLWHELGTGFEIGAATAWFPAAVVVGAVIGCGCGVLVRTGSRDVSPMRWVRAFVIPTFAVGCANLVVLFVLVLGSANSQS